MSVWLIHTTEPLQLFHWRDKRHGFLEELIPTDLSKVLDISFWSKNN